MQADNQLRRLSDLLSVVFRMRRDKAQVSERNVSIAKCDATGVSWLKGFNGEDRSRKLDSESFRTFC